MTTKSQGVIKAFLNLSDTDKDEVKKFIDDYNKSDYFQKGEKVRDLNEAFKRIMGPTSQDRCPVCGK